MQFSLKATGVVKQSPTILGLLTTSPSWAQKIGIYDFEMESEEAGKHADTKLIKVHDTEVSIYVVYIYICVCVCVSKSAGPIDM